ncbi:hypothetical protein ACGFXC_10520 [Streptomyces sp. NPDC048507]|uniref:hypothetical protein n=1 Tax=Streptomyces sp. NPDC048507 TaxID=3365560 RepID=UPI0037187D85
MTDAVTDAAQQVAADKGKVLEDRLAGLRKTADRPSPALPLAKQTFGLANALEDLFLSADSQSDRSRQRAIGPSEVGDDCARRLRYKVIGTPPVRQDQDSWAAILGTSAHLWIAEVFRQRNRTLGRERYLIEHRVTVRPGMTGQVDLYDKATATAYDWKLVGPETLRSYGTQGPPNRYLVQGQLYGRGLQNEGLEVRKIAIVVLPRAAKIRDKAQIWSYAPDQDVVDASLARLDEIAGLPAGTPMDVIPATAQSECRWCPWFDPGHAVEADERGCRGGHFARRRKDTCEDLIA